MGNFAFNLKKLEKKLDVMVEGKFAQEDALKFIAEYDKNVKTFNPGEFVIEFDARNLKVSTQEMIPLLEQCFTMYKATGFKKVIMKIQKDPIMKMQLSRVARNTGLLNCDIIEA